MSGSRAFTAIVNPAAGSGKAYARWSPIAARLGSAGLDVRVELSRSGEHATTLAVAAAAAGRVVVAVGGDGLVRDVAGGVVPAAGVMAVVPAGRNNDLAGRLGLPGDEVGLAELLRAGSIHSYDVLEVTGDGSASRGGVIVPGNVYCGVDSVADAAGDGSRLLGALGARSARRRAVSGWEPASYALGVDGQRRAVIAHTVVVANTGVYRGGTPIVPVARPNDGWADLLIVDAGRKGAVTGFLRQAPGGGHVERPDVELGTAHQVSIAADRDLPVYGDGDPIGSLPVTVSVRPGALRLLVPRPRPGPGRPAAAGPDPAG